VEEDAAEECVDGCEHCEMWVVAALTEHGTMCLPLIHRSLSLSSLSLRLSFSLSLSLLLCHSTMSLSVSLCRSLSLCRIHLCQVSHRLFSITDHRNTG
jgi:hypothetical protein